MECMNSTSGRIRRVFHRIEGELPEVLLIKNSTAPHIDLSFFYFTGLESGVFENSVFLAYPDGDSTLYTSSLEEESTKKTSNRLKTIITDDDQQLDNYLKKLCSNIGKIGVNSKEITYKDILYLQRILPNVKLIDVSSAITATRLIKEKEELAHIKKAAYITCSIWDVIIQMLEDGVSESEVKAEICFRIRKESSALAFEPIVSFCTNTAEPHYLGGDGRLKNGDFVLLDFGARHRNYCADVTRTLVYGKASTEQRQLFETVAAANLIGIESIKAGVEAREVHHKVSHTIVSKGFGTYFTHATGHAIGLSVHDGAQINASSNLVLEEGMVFTVEPGVYIPSFGGVRIEDDVVVHKDGCEILTSLKRELVEL